MTTLTINGQPHQQDAPEDMPLLGAIRDLVGHTGTKGGCGRGLYGYCQSGQVMTTTGLLRADQLGA